MTSTNQKILRTMIAGLAFCFLMASYYIIQPTRASIIFAHLGRGYFHLFYFFNAVITLLGVFLYNRLVSRYSRTLFIRILFITTISLFVIFWLGFHFWLPFQEKIFSQGHYDWWVLFSVDCILKLIATYYHFFLSIYILLFTSIFWSFNHDIHNPSDAKIAYAYISLGGQIGVMLGSKFTEIFSKMIGSYNIIWFSIIGLILCWNFIETLKYCRTENPAPKENIPPTGILKDFNNLFTSRYAIYIALLVMLGTYTITICDYQYKMLMDAQIKNLNPQTSFLAGNNFIMGLGNIIMTLAVTPLLFFILGPVISISIFPIAIMIIGIFFLFGMNIYTAAWFAIAISCLNYTLYQVGKEIFYVPTDKTTKYKIKAFCDIFGYRLGDALGGLTITIYKLIFSLIPGVVFFVPGLSFIVIIAVIVWFFVLAAINKDYLKMSKKKS